jgi:hypothetical protein
MNDMLFNLNTGRVTKETLKFSNRQVLVSYSSRYNYLGL